MRPPQLTDGPLTRHYRSAANRFLKDALKISRADVADFMLANLTDKSTYQAIVEIAY
jgi:hypothetical protein